MRPAGPVEPAGAVVPGHSPLEPEAAGDVLEISTIARLAAKIRDIPDVRTDLVDRVRVDIAAGTYETTQRIEITIDRLMEELLPGF